MLTVKFAGSFLKTYKHRIKDNRKLKTQFEKRLDIFISNRNHSSLKDHQLIGKAIGLRAFSVTGDIRVIYYFESESVVWFIDIGSHNQVY